MRNFDKSCSFTVGRLLWRYVREILESEKFSGREIEWREGGGWIEHIFTIRGVGADVDAVVQRLTYYFECNGVSSHAT